MSISDTPSPQVNPESSATSGTLRESLGENSLQTLQSSQADLQSEIDRVKQEMEILRGWFQTLVSGLIIAIVISISIASWFAYQLLLQQQTANQEAEDAASVREDLLERVTQLEDKNAEINDQLSTRSAELRGTLQTQQSDLEQLRERLNRIESRQTSLEVESSKNTPETSSSSSDR